MLDLITIMELHHLRLGRRLNVSKEPNNPYDGEAIKATMKQIGTIGYVANSPYTVATGTKSAEESRIR